MLGGSPGGPGELWGCSGCFWGAPLCAGGSSRCRGQPRGSNLLFGVSPPTHPGAALGVRVCFGGAPVYFRGAAPSAWGEPWGSRETLGCTPGGWDWGFGAPQSAWGERRGSQFALGVSQFTLGGHRGLGGRPRGQPLGGAPGGDQGSLLGDPKRGFLGHLRVDFGGPSVPRSLGGSRVTLGGPSAPAPTGRGSPGGFGGFLRP